jgi:hypothetical protein
MYLENLALTPEPEPPTEWPLTTSEEIDYLWGRFDETSAQLVKAKRRLRAGTGTEIEVQELRCRLSAWRADLAARGEYADATEPGEVEPARSANLFMRRTSNGRAGHDGAASHYT